ncbi:MAG: hypothetical protein JST10_15495 [Bacteroidetes bacterium]|nr:hypothetical protein [Bacteroidota bacterium]
MQTKKVIRKIVFASIWLTIGTGIAILLVAAIGKKNKDLCSDIHISIKGNQDQFFITEKDVLQLLFTATHGKIKGQPMSSIDLVQLKRALENNKWIQEAQLYFDNNNMLQGTIWEREPIARIFTIGNKSFYMDKGLKRIPLSERVSAKVPVFTDYPENIENRKDSLLRSEIRDISEFILHNTFWMSQVAQINIDDDYEFEMIPVIGNHSVVLGDGKNIEQKLNRLMVFYKEVLSKTGFDKYASIDVRFAGQVVAVKGKTKTRIDSIQLRKNVEKMLVQARLLNSDTAFTTVQTTEKPMTKRIALENQDDLPGENDEKATDPAIAKTAVKSNRDEKSKTPKAVMSKQNKKESNKIKNN